MNFLKSLSLIILTLITYELFAQDPFIGEIRMFGGSYAPRGWALCNGQLLSVSANEALFSILGTTYGGDGRTTFGLPDLRGRSAVGAGNGPGLNNIVRGHMGGTESITLNNNHLPSHNHTGYIKIADGEGDLFESNDDYIPQNTSVEYQQYKDSNSATFTNAKIEGVVTNNTGGNHALPIRDPYIGVNYIICLVGTYPPRN